MSYLYVFSFVCIVLFLYVLLCLNSVIMPLVRDMEHYLNHIFMYYPKGELLLLLCHLLLQSE